MMETMAVGLAASGATKHGPFDPGRTHHQTHPMDRPHELFGPIAPAHPFRDGQAGQCRLGHGRDEPGRFLSRRHAAEDQPSPLVGFFSPKCFDLHPAGPRKTQGGLARIAVRVERGLDGGSTSECLLIRLTVGDAGDQERQAARRGERLDGSEGDRMRLELRPESFLKCACQVGQGDGRSSSVPISINRSVVVSNGALPLNASASGNQGLPVCRNRLAPRRATGFAP